MGSSGESLVGLAAWAGDGESHSPDGQLPPKAERTPKDRWPPSQGDPSLPASGTVPPATHSIVPLTHPCSPRLCHWGQRGGRRSGWPLQGLSLGGQGSQVSTHTASFPAPPRRNPECGREPSRSQKAGRGCPIQSAPLGSETLGLAVFLKCQAWPGGWDWGFGSESEGILPSPESWGDRCSWNAEVGPTSSGWARARWGLDWLWVGFRPGPGGVHTCCPARDSRPAPGSPLSFSPNSVRKTVKLMGPFPSCSMASSSSSGTFTFPVGVLDGHRALECP